ncbi:MAG: cytochrome P450 [Sumerlaeia bacterium]
MAVVPQTNAFDSTPALLREGYRFVSNRCEALNTDIFRTRLMLKQAVCMRGEEAARVFYEPGRMTRRKAMPPTALMLLQDFGSVQTLDGEAHRHRKEMFMALMTPESMGALTDGVEETWRRRLRDCQEAGRVELHWEFQSILCEAVCAWAGLPLDEGERERRTREFAAMIGGAGAFGPKNWHAMALRRRCELWTRRQIAAIRAGRRAVPGGSAADLVAAHQDLDGRPLDEKIAAVELVNLLRPTVAVARYLVFVAMALEREPAAREKLRGPGAEDYETWFVQEVRRFYPYFPIIAGRVREPFIWRDHEFGKDDWVVLDLYGTNHDPRTWEDPDVFRPERFANWDGSPFGLIPQGGGDHHTGHRCAGEWVTIELMKRGLRRLGRELRYRVPEQDLTLAMSRMPAIPPGGFVIEDVRPAED